jgi:hypothetical protein
LLQSEVDQLELMIDKMMSNQACVDLIRGINVDYEVPGIAELEGRLWKGKADIVNHDEKLIVDLKTQLIYRSLDIPHLSTITTVKLIYIKSFLVMN